MLYSQLHRSIRHACLDFTRHPYPMLVASLPFLICVSTAHGEVRIQDGPDYNIVLPKTLHSNITAQPSSLNSANLDTVGSKPSKATKDLKASTPIKSSQTPSDTTTVTKPSNKVESAEQYSNNVATSSTTIASDTASSETTTSENKLASKTSVSKQRSDNAGLKESIHKDATTSLQPILKPTPPIKVDASSSAPSNSTVSSQITDDVSYPRRSNNDLKKANDVSTPRVKTDQNTDDVLNEKLDADLSDAEFSKPNLSKADLSEDSVDKDSIDQKNIDQKNMDKEGLDKESFDKDSVEYSLQRLAKFYHITDKDLNAVKTKDSAETSGIHPTQLNNKQGLDIESNLNADSTFDTKKTVAIDATKTAPVALPKLFNKQDDDWASQRCEGVWVTPKNIDNNSGYAQAIDNAKQEAGLSTANGLPIYAKADYAYFDNKDYLELTGNVQVLQDGQLLNAEQLSMDLNSGIAGVQGNILLADSATPHPNNTTHSQGSGLIVVADDMAYDTNSNAATANNVAFASVPMQAHGYAQKLNKPDDTHYELDNVMFSTCPPTNRKWQLEAKQIDINSETGRGEAYDATFRLGKVPVFYLPYFNFPVDDRRSSGLLTPSMGLNSDSGLKVSLPYYLNLAPNYDATITTNVYSNRNPMLEGEFRYLTDGYGEGSLSAAYLPKDKEYDDKDRRGVFYKHEWTPENIHGLSADVVYNYVSDAEYIDDFDDFGLTDNRLNLPRRAQVNYYNDYVNARLKVETFQSLDAVDAQGNRVEDKDKPYSRLPQLSIDYRLPKLNNFLDNFSITGEHDSAYFKKSIDDGSENEKSGVRFYNKIGASYPIEKTWGYITPKVSLQHLYTFYDEESRIDNQIDKDDNSQSALVPQFSVDSGLNFYQAGSPFGLFNQSLGGYQLLSPRLKYTYSPYDDQSNIPNFNTRIASVDYNQLFADSWFLGHDRLPDNNNIALGFNYRYIDAMGVTRFDGSIGDQFYLSNTKVTLDADDRVFDESSSGVAWNSSIQPYRNIWFDFNGALDSDNNLNFINSQIRYQPTPHSLFNFGVIKRHADANTNQSELSALTASTIFPISNNWRFMAQGQYDTISNKFIDSTVGIDYEDCCYGFSIYGRSYYNDLNLENKPTNAIMAEFRINGLGSNKGRFSKLLGDKILGFEPVDTVWKNNSAVKR